MSTNETESGLKIEESTLITFAIALLLHSFIDGLSVGVFAQPEDMSLLATSVIIHKIPVSCTLGFTFE